ncbi:MULTISPECIES: nucleopolyhedrovirus P10 family protein [unclassified Streptomyces]|uniref:nucleopolyhedrovirus P10 family protein n=1 Tax=unclassified Streptomyces TaxID=2593676 RepID=UPI001F039AEA|nr:MULTISPECIES: nucleopolyhedrovirus P10 family protein [unclassified Streptomyces]MCH0562606.1 nucleopolyhedrovirus P10 family protein [Streptomyces sp. MUM 2J]MCH0567884.1 nucleopolyhedrovirus P10 family protein [Streptomyces sp. MUM 136J]
MTAQQWTQHIRHRLALGRLVPLGGPRDGSWIAERAAGAVLRRAAADVPGVRLGGLRIALADPEGAAVPVVPPPPSALPPGALRVSAELSATAAEPLPVATGRLRAALGRAARDLGLEVTEVDLRVTALLEEEPAPETVRVPPPEPAAESTGPDEARAARAARSVAGVAALTGVLGHAVHVQEEARPDTLPRRYVRVEIAVGAGHRAVEVAREARAAVSAAWEDHPIVAVLVTAVG